ncbi:MAG: hypothetical protein AAF224_01440 [Pseudomonadota bacterium]
MTFPFSLGVSGVHEVVEAAHGDLPAATGFALAAALSSSLASSPLSDTPGAPSGACKNLETIAPPADNQAANQAILWISQYGPTAEHGGLSPTGLQSFLGAPAPPQILIVRTRRKVDALWAVEEALVSGAAGLVVADISDLDFTASRRLTLAARRSGTPTILLCPYARQGSSAADARWRIAPAPSTKNPFDPMAPGNPAWRVHLERARHAPGEVGKTFTLEYDNETLSLNLVADLAVNAPRPLTHENATERSRVLHWPERATHAETDGNTRNTAENAPAARKNRL